MSDTDDVDLDLDAALAELAQVEKEMGQIGELHAALGIALGGLRALKADPELVAIVQKAFDAFQSQDKP